MINKDLTQYKQALVAKRAELSAGFHVDEIVVERQADPADEIQRAAESELALRRLAWQTATLRDAVAALRRIDDGSYGICVECDEQISPKRLAVFPWTPVCVKCQGAAEGEEQPRSRLMAA